MLERDEAEAANERIAKMAEELRKAELVRDRLEGLNQLMGSYPEGHDMRACLGTLHLEQALEGWRKIFGSLPKPPTSRRDLRPRRQRY